MEREREREREAEGEGEGEGEGEREGERMCPCRSVLSRAMLHPKEVTWPCGLRQELACDM